MRAVLDLDEEDTKEIQDEGALQGVRLDSYARMSRRALEDYARTKDRKLGQGRDQLRKEKEENGRLRKELAGEPREEIQEAMLRLHIALTQIMTYFADEVSDMSDAEAEALRKDKGWSIYCAIMAKVNELRPVIIDEWRLTH